MMTPELKLAIQQQVALALAEDLGSGDLTAQLIAKNTMAEATIISREPAIVCGIPWADACFHQISTDVVITWHVQESERIHANQLLCTLTGPARALLTAERCALNFLQILSATATQTHGYVEAIAGTNARILDTRKTIPGFRLAQKYAVRIGGGDNQRIGLYDGILIKENHIAAAGGIAPALKQATLCAQKAGRQEVSIQIEVENLQQLQEALAAGAKLILLDNFSLNEMAEAVKFTAGSAVLEASGGVSLTSVRAIAETGVDRISIGGITKHIQAIDLSMRFKELT